MNSATIWTYLRILIVTDHRFHTKAITNFISKRSAFSFESDRRFHRNPITRSAP